MEPMRLLQGNNGGQYVMDVELLEVREVFPDGQRFEEAFWTSERMDWLLASHDDSLTVAGQWLLDEVKRVWPAWESGLSYYDLRAPEQH